MANNLSNLSVTSSDNSLTIPTAKRVPNELTMAIFVVFFTLIVCSNIWVMIAVVRQSKLRKSSTCMFIISLSISDLMMAFFYIPMQVAYVGFGLAGMSSVVLCKGTAWLQWVAQCATIFSLIGIGIDRYRAIVQPLHPKLTRTDAAVCIAVIWICAGTYSSHRMYVLDIVTFTHPVGFNVTVSTSVCAVPSDKYYLLSYLEVSDFLVMYLVPLIILCVMYAIMVSSLWFSSAPNDESKQKKRKAVKMLILVVVLFCISWFPWRFFSLYFQMTDITTIPVNIYIWSDVIAATCITLYLSNSWVNPFLYAYFNQSFRDEFYRLFSWILKRKSKVTPSTGQTLTITTNSVNNTLT
ncbi:galanin receptor 2b-like [Saccoglossus kowalevskii]|uniref:Neuropeptide FF receptor 2-like n=1 Tax=Saccoglossus kowalevskii TaxID=10224 RepID=A0ABM0GXP7_SACKO|nr:PREDICTED: neuropeptide FF receptor 2-like [Saccoglossus kowalevskii]